MLAQLRSPDGIVLTRIVVDGLFDPAMHPQVALLVAGQAQHGHGHLAVARGLGDGAG
ncbi:hypothetical protein D9M71_764600 [compost metagenome]